MALYPVKDGESTTGKKLGKVCAELAEAVKAHNAIFDVMRPLVQTSLGTDIGNALAKGCNPSDPAFWEAMGLPEDGSQDFSPFDPFLVRIKHDRIKLAGFGWVRMDANALPPKNAKLTKVGVRGAGDGWTVDVEASVAATT